MSFRNIEFLFFLGYFYDSFPEDCSKLYVFISSMCHHSVVQVNNSMFLAYKV